MKLVFITGASGTMGCEALTQIVRTGKFRCRVILRAKKANRRLARKLQKNACIEVRFMHKCGMTITSPMKLNCIRRMTDGIY